MSLQATFTSLANIIRIKHAQFIKCQTFRTFKTNLRLAVKQSFILADIGEGIKEVTIKEWFVKVGDKISQFDEVCEVQSDKASVTITSRYDGVVSKLYYKINDIAIVGKPLVDIESDDSSVKVLVAQNAKESLAEHVVPSQNQSSYKKYICIPSVRRLIKEHQLELTQINGSGKDGRILKEDVLKHVNNRSSNEHNDESNENSVENKDKIVPIQGVQQAMFKSMTAANSVPAFGYCDELVLTNLSKIRESKEFQEECANNNIKMTYMPFFIKALSNALFKYPILNASLDPNHENVIYKRVHNIGIGMDSKIGLIVPVIKTVEKLKLVDIAKELKRLMVFGKAGKLSTDDFQGGTITLSNVGVIGGTYVAPLILPPQVAIIGIGKMQTLPRFDKSGNIIAEKIVYLSAAADHRIIDGATMANFINLFKKQLEYPYLLFLHL